MESHRSEIAVTGPAGFDARGSRHDRIKTLGDSPQHQGCSATSPSSALSTHADCVSVARVLGADSFDDELAGERFVGAEADRRFRGVHDRLPFARATRMSPLPE